MAKIDTEKIKKAFDDFEADNFVDAEENIKSEIHTALMDHIKTKLNLKKNLEKSVDKETEETETTEND